MQLFYTWRSAALSDLLPAASSTIFNSLVHKMLISGHLCRCQDERWVCRSILGLVLFNRCRGHKKCNMTTTVTQFLISIPPFGKIYASEKYANLITITVLVVKLQKSNQLQTEHIVSHKAHRSSFLSRHKLQRVHKLHKNPICVLSINTHRK